MSISKTSKSKLSSTRVSKTSQKSSPTSCIAELRNRSNLTQAELAAHVKVSVTTVQNWESDKGLEQIERLLRLCAILDCDLDELIEYPDSIDQGPRSLDYLRELGRRFRNEAT